VTRATQPRHCWGHRRDPDGLIEDCPLRHGCVHWYIRSADDAAPVPPAWGYERGVPMCPHHDPITPKR